MKSFVLDNSVAVCWFLKPQSTPYTEKVLRRLASGDTPIVPALWVSEFTNVIAKAVQSKALDAESAEEIMLHASALPIKAQPSPKLTDLFAIAQKHQLSAYDATYLELSLRLKIPLATADARLMKAAKTQGLFLS